MNICFAFVSTKAVLVRKSRRTFRTHNPKAPSVRELPTKSGEGERVTIELVQIQSYAGSFRHAIACHLPPGGRLCCRPIVHLKSVTHYTMHSKACEKGQRIFMFSVLFAVGVHRTPLRNCFCTAGKTCFMEGAPSKALSFTWRVEG